MNQEMWTASRIQKRQENGFFLEPPERKPCQYVGFSPMRLMLDLCGPIDRTIYKINRFASLQTTKFVIISF